MNKVLFSLVAAGAALGFAAPASAQVYHTLPYPAYGNGYGSGYGQVHQLQARIDALQNRIRFLDRRDVIRNRTADQLKNEARDIEKQLRRSARYGLNPYEMNGIQMRIARLEQRVQFASQRFGGRGYGYNGYNNGGSYGDRDRDGRDDRWEDDRGYDRDD